MGRISTKLAKQSSEIKKESEAGHFCLTKALIERDEDPSVGMARDQVVEEVLEMEACLSKEEEAPNKNMEGSQLVEEVMEMKEGQSTVDDSTEAHCEQSAPRFCAPTAKYVPRQHRSPVRSESFEYSVAGLSKFGRTVAELTTALASMSASTKRKRFGKG
jgi:hypothetical protein